MRLARIVFHVALPVDVFEALSRLFAWLLPVNSEQIWPHLCASTRASDLRNLAAVCHRHSVCRPAVCVLRSPLTILTQAYGIRVSYAFHTTVTCQKLRLQAESVKLFPCDLSHVKAS